MGAAVDVAAGTGKLRL